MVVTEPGGDFALQEGDVPQPGSGQALVRVRACGVCHSDMFAKEGSYRGGTHPLVPGHEIAGEIAALGDDVKGGEVGQRARTSSCRRSPCQTPWAPCSAACARAAG